MPRTPRPVARLVAAAFAVAAALVVTARPAAAHAELVTTDPPAGTTLAVSPDSVSVTFSEPVQAPGDSVRLHDAGGDVVPASGIQRADGGRTLLLDLDDELAEGGYVLSWRVISTDGHPIGGAVTWRIGEGGAEVDAGLLEELLAAEGGDTGVGAVSAVARGILFLGLALLIGGWAFGAFPESSGIADAARSRLVRIGWALAVVGTVAGLALQGADVAGGGLADALRPSVTGDVLDTDYGRAALFRLALLGVATAYLAPAQQGRWRSGIARLVVATSLATSVTLAGHARTGRWTTLAVPLDVVHLLAGAAWVGGLAALLVSLRSDVGEGGAKTDAAVPSVIAVARRFSSVAFAAIGIVAVTGAVQGIRQTGGLDGLGDNSFGRLLTAKVIGVGALLTLAVLSRSTTRLGTTTRSLPRAEPAGSPTRQPSVGRLRQSVAGEAAMAVVVLAVTSLLVAANPARGEPADAWGESKVVGGTVIEAIVAPASTGPVTMHLYVQDPASGLVGAAEATARLSLPGKGIEGLEVLLFPAGRNHFTSPSTSIPIAGDWTLEIAVRIGELTQKEATFTVPIR